MKQDSPQVLWIRVWIGIGVVGFVLFIVVTASIMATVKREVTRRADCATGAREDCLPSFIWTLQDAWREGRTSVKPGSDETRTMEKSGTRQTVTSERAPRVTIVDRSEWSLVDGVYRLPKGALGLAAGVEGEVDRVDVLYIPQDTLTPGIGKKIGELEKAVNRFVGQVTLTSNMNGELEIRAMKGMEYGSLIVRFAVE